MQTDISQAAENIQHIRLRCFKAFAAYVYIPCLYNVHTTTYRLNGHAMFAQFNVDGVPFASSSIRESVAKHSQNIKFSTFFICRIYFAIENSIQYVCETGACQQQVVAKK